MTRVAPLPESEAADRLERTYGRIRELLGADSVPEPFLTYGRVEPFLQDFYMNFRKFVFNAGQLDERTKAIIALAVSAHYGCGVWLDFFSQRLRQIGGDAAPVPDIIAVASTNAMYNAFFKFRSLSGSPLFEGMPVGLRAHTFTGTALDERTVELINIAISDLNACGPCTAGHVEAARRLGLTDEQLLEAIQCAATMAAGCAFLKAAEA